MIRLKEIWHYMSTCLLFLSSITVAYGFSAGANIVIVKPFSSNKPLNINYEIIPCKKYIHNENIDKKYFAVLKDTVSFGTGAGKQSFTFKPNYPGVYIINFDVDGKKITNNAATKKIRIRKNSEITATFTIEQNDTKIDFAIHQDWTSSLNTDPFFTGLYKTSYSYGWCCCSCLFCKDPY